MKFPTEWKVIKVMFQTTKQLLLGLPHYLHYSPIEISGIKNYGVLSSQGLQNSEKSLTKVDDTWQCVKTLYPW